MFFFHDTEVLVSSSMDPSSLLTSLMRFLIILMRDVLSFVLDVDDVHSLSCVEGFLAFSTNVGVDLDLFDKSLEFTVVTYS